jgi:hypothetical protein
MSKVQHFEFCPEHMVSFLKGGDCHVCGKSLLEKLTLEDEPKRKPLPKKDPDDISMSWRELLYKLQDLDALGKNLDGTVCISDQGSETFGSKLICDHHGIWIEGF